MRSGLFVWKHLQWLFQPWVLSHDGGLVEAGATYKGLSARGGGVEPGLGPHFRKAV